MKKLSLINKIFFLVNTFFAILLLLSYSTPYIRPSSISTSPLLSLVTPILIFVNLAFIIYWLLIGFKKQYLLSSIILILSFFISSSIYKFGSNPSDKYDKELSIMSYNVRKFNIFEWLKDKNIDSKISDFISTEKPDILTVQEFKENENFNINYPFKYNPITWGKSRSGLAIYSKFAIINSGIIKSHKRVSRSIFADIVKNNDTVRVYNFHLYSLGVDPDNENFGDPDSKKLLKRLIHSLKLQEKEVNSLINHIQNCKYKVILAGDMNNTAFSWAYKNLKGDLNDSFLEKGKGFGRSYSFKDFPFRIDYIFVDKDITILNHKNYNEHYSDHYPVMATVSF